MQIVKDENAMMWDDQSATMANEGGRVEVGDSERKEECKLCGKEIPLQNMQLHFLQVHGDLTGLRNGGQQELQGSAAMLDGKVGGAPHSAREQIAALLSERMRTSELKALDPKIQVLPGLDTMIQWIPPLQLQLRAEKEKGRRELLRRFNEAWEQERTKVAVVFDEARRQWLEKLGGDRETHQIQKASRDQQLRLSAGIGYLAQSKEKEQQGVKQETTSGVGAQDRDSYMDKQVIAQVESAFMSDQKIPRNKDSGQADGRQGPRDAEIKDLDLLEQHARALARQDQLGNKQALGDGRKVTLEMALKNELQVEIGKVLGLQRPEPVQVALPFEEAAGRPAKQGKRSELFAGHQGQQQRAAQIKTTGFNSKSKQPRAGKSKDGLVSHQQQLNCKSNALAKTGRPETNRADLEFDVHEDSVSCRTTPVLNNKYSTHKYPKPVAAGIGAQVPSYPRQKSIGKQQTLLDGQQAVIKKRARKPSSGEQRLENSPHDYESRSAILNGRGNQGRQAGPLQRQPRAGSGGGLASGHEKKRYKKSYEKKMDSSGMPPRGTQAPTHPFFSNNQNQAKGNGEYFTSLNKGAPRRKKYESASDDSLSSQGSRGPCASKQATEKQKAHIAPNGIGQGEGSSLNHGFKKPLDQHQHGQIPHRDAQFAFAYHQGASHQQDSHRPSAHDSEALAEEPQESGRASINGDQRHGAGQNMARSSDKQSGKATRSTNENQKKEPKSTDQSSAKSGSAGSGAKSSKARSNKQQIQKENRQKELERRAEEDRRPLTVEEAESCMFYFNGRALHAVEIEKENLKSATMGAGRDYPVLKRLPDKLAKNFGLVVLEVEVDAEFNKEVAKKVTADSAHNVFSSFGADKFNSQRSIESGQAKPPSEKVITVFGYNTDYGQFCTARYHPDRNELEDPPNLRFPSSEAKAGYALCVHENKHVFVIGGTAADSRYSPNFFLTPRFVPAEKSSENIEVDGAEEARNGAAGSQANGPGSAENTDKVLEFEYTVLPQLNYPRSHCSLFIYNGNLFVLYGQGRKRDAAKPKATPQDLYARRNENHDIYKNEDQRVPVGDLTQGITQIEFAPIDELLSYRGRDPDGDQTEMQLENGGLRNPFRVLEVAGDSTFLRPMVFENHESLNCLYIFGGCRSDRQGREGRTGPDHLKPMHTLEIEFTFEEGCDGGSSLIPIPTCATLQTTDVKVRGNAGFSQTFTTNRYWQKGLKQWAFLDEQGGVHLISPEAKMYKLVKGW